MLKGIDKGYYSAAYVDGIAGANARPELVRRQVELAISPAQGIFRV